MFYFKESFMIMSFKPLILILELNYMPVNINCLCAEYFFCT